LQEDLWRFAYCSPYVPKPESHTLPSNRDQFTSETSINLAPAKHSSLSLAGFHFSKGPRLKFSYTNKDTKRKLASPHSEPQISKLEPSKCQIIGHEVLSKWLHVLSSFQFYRL
jgi:hypothetical protein